MFVKVTLTLVDSAIKYTPMQANNYILSQRFVSKDKTF